MGYNRQKAVNYATQYANFVTHDQLVATVIDKKTILEPYRSGTNISQLSIKGENDCTHFVSCCIGSPGGGFNIGQWEFGSAYGILSAPNLARKLKQSGVQVVGEHVKREEVPSLLSAMEKGDVIGYTTGSSYVHTALYMGDGKISCHTSCRLNKPWNDIFVGDRISLFHFVT